MRRFHSFLLAPRAPRQVRQAAMECLVGIGHSYYDQLEPYIKDIFALTCKAVSRLFRQRSYINL